MRDVLTGLRIVFSRRSYQVAATAVFAFALPFYLMTLPSSFTGGRIGITALRYLDVELVFFALVMAVLVTLLIPLIVYLLKQGRRASKAPASGGVAVGVLTPLLCCSPALPIALGFVAGVFPSLMGAGGVGLQGFIATHETELFSVATLLLLVALYQNARSAAKGPSCQVPDTRTAAAPRRTELT